MDRRVLESRRETNPVFNGRKLKLGTFGTNCSNAVAITTIENRYRASWDNTRRLALLADEMEFEAIVPIARWKGFGGQADPMGDNLEAYTWAAGLGEATENVCVMATSHVPTVHPLMAAKHATTIDHITGGRFALNIVCGWFKDELDMFGAPMMEHDEAYDYAAEWIEVIQRLWTTEGEFDFDGKWFHIKKGAHAPKPVQAPYPALMNAGRSEKGRHFAAKYCDLAFISGAFEPDTMAALIDSYRRLAREEYGREIQVWTYAYVVQGETEKEALDYFNHYVRDHGDTVAARTLMENIGVPIGTMSADAIEQAMLRFIAGWNGYPLVGTRDQIVDALQTLSDRGLDGCLVTWAEYETGLVRFKDEILPLLGQAGLR